MLGVAFVLLAVGAVVLVRRGGDSRSSASPPPAGAPGGSILEFLNQPGGREVVVPNGHYTGGKVSAAHDDWLILRAETQGQVIVDLDDTGLQLDEGTSKVLFVGFTFVNGEVRLGGVTDVAFWYCDFSFPPEQWTRQYQKAGGTTAPADRKVRDDFGTKMPNPLPTGIRLRTGEESNVGNTRVGVFGSDLHDLGDDGLFLTDAKGIRLEGLRIWNIDEKSSDPGQSLGSNEDWFHNDGIQTVGGIQDVHILDSWIGQKVQWGAEDSDIRDVEFRRLWYAGSSTFGQINEVKGSGRILNNTQQDIRAFGNGQRGAKSDPAFDLFRTDFVDGKQRAVWPNDFSQRGVFEMTSSAVTEEAPPGVAVADGVLVNVAQLLDRPDNPANQWRTAHPYATYSAYVLAG